MVSSSIQQIFMTPQKLKKKNIIFGKGKFLGKQQKSREESFMVKYVVIKYRKPAQREIH
jgi:hypothetical protein